MKNHVFTGFILFSLVLGSCRDIGDEKVPELTIAVGYEHSCALLKNKSVKCWGSNENGQLGLGDTDNRGDGEGEMGSNLPYVNLGKGRSVKAIASGSDHVCALLDNNRVKCWGYNSEDGELGLGDADNRGDQRDEMGDDLPFVDLGTGRTVKFIASGDYHSCAILDNDSVKCWGINEYGSLGQGHNFSRGGRPNEMGDALPAIDLGIGRVAKSITLGGDHACALLDNRLVKCWGYNNVGQLGQGDTDNRGDDVGEMGEDLLFVDLGLGRTVKSVSASGDHTCALLDDHSVKCWGYNDFGQLGQGDTNHRGDEANEMGEALLAVNLGAGRRAKEISSGGYHTCALLDDHSIKCWGFNAFGQLGLGSTRTWGDGEDEIGDYLPRVDLGIGFIPHRLSRGGSSGYHVCAVSVRDSVKCWGINDYGVLGLGDSNHRGDGGNEMGDHLPVIEL